jgi:hypothetical protein
MCSKIFLEALWTFKYKKYTIFLEKSERKSQLLGIGTGRRTILKWNLEKQDWRFWTGVIWISMVINCEEL